MSEETKVKTKNNKRLLVIITAIILLLAIICGGIYYYKTYLEARSTFKRAIDSSIKAYQEGIEKDQYKTVDAKIGANLQLELEDNSDENAKIVDFINALDVELNLQMDRENKKLVAKLDSKYENDNLLNADMYVDVENKKLYMYLKDIFDKYLENDIEDEIDEDVIELFNKTYTDENKENLKKASKIIGKELKNIIKKENCSRNKEEITINNEKENVNKNTISITYAQLLNEFETIGTNLKNNKEFISCFEKQDEVDEYLDNLIEDIKTEKEYSYDNVNIEISIYTTGILQKFVKLDMQVQEDEQTVKMEINKKDEQNYEYIYTNTYGEMIKLDIKKLQDNKYSGVIEANISNVDKIIINLDISFKLNEEIDKIDTTNVINVKDITEEDANTIIENFKKTKLYETVNKISGGIFENILANRNKLDEQEDEEWEEDYDDYIEDSDSDEIM